MAAIVPSPRGIDGFERRRVSVTAKDHTQEISSEEQIRKYLQGLSTEASVRENGEAQLDAEDGVNQDYGQDSRVNPEERSLNGSATVHQLRSGQIAAEDPIAQRGGRGPNESRTVQKSSPTKMYELTSPECMSSKQNHRGSPDGYIAGANGIKANGAPVIRTGEQGATNAERANEPEIMPSQESEADACVSPDQPSPKSRTGKKPSPTARTVSTPLLRRRSSFSKGGTSTRSHHASISKHPKVPPLPLRFEDPQSASRHAPIESPEPSPMPQSIPVPPLSLPTYLQLELSSQRPSPRYIHRSITSDFPYESSRVKIDRLKNFFLVPLELEQILWFGALACLDAWLFSFTILPLRFLKALLILSQSSGGFLLEEVSLCYEGLGKLWRRKQRRQLSLGASITPSSKASPTSIAPKPNHGTQRNSQESDYEIYEIPFPQIKTSARRDSFRRHQRHKSIPSKLEPDHRADILKGLLILSSCVILMYFDASRMYHGIRGQAAIKLYVIYNVLEVCDRLFSAIGQDVLECLFSKETLERKSDGRSKVLRPAWLFVLALCYNVIHSTALFYQVITLNVAVNSYSNALLTLLMSNQFVEIKSTVFKKFEKENLFQLTCADVVERFQLWLMLTIIASRNIIETGGLSLTSAGSSIGGEIASPYSFGSSILPKSFTIFPDWTGQVMGPFFLVLGSEMLVDWIKHAYITKFNMTKPIIYGRFLDILAKDYYSNAFADQNLTRRLGLPVIPLACLFIRASVQTYHMFLATHMPASLPSTATSISLESASASPATTAAIQHIDQIFRRALGRSTLGAGGPTVNASIWNLDDFIAFITMAVFFLVLYLVLLAFKLILGMVLLSYARHRYMGMKRREGISVHADGRRVGGWGVVEVDEDKRRWIYADDPNGAHKLRERERNMAEKEKKVDKEGRESFANVSRYSMAAKRIW